jgi:hypothetical protein
MRPFSDTRGFPDRRVRIVGGGLTGILAAFEAHRLGWRDITLHERFEALGGALRPKLINGRELRNACVSFGGPDDPIVKTLTAHGARFETFDNRFGGLGIGADGHRLFTWDFAGPAIDTPAIKVSKPADDSLAARLAAYPPQIAAELEAYVRWRLETDPALAHADAAIPLGIDRVFPAAADLTALADARASDPWAAKLLGVPRGLSNQADDPVASLPAGGFVELFDGLHRALTRLGVKVELNSLASPRQLMGEASDDETIVWAANPTPLFKPLDLTAPALAPKCVFTHVFEVAAFDGPCPVHVHNFTTRGSVFRASLYESGDDKLLLAECVREPDFKTLPTELRTLLSGFGSLTLGAMVHSDVQPCWIAPSLVDREGLAALRGKLAERFGRRFIPGAWEPHAQAAKLAQINAALALARDVTPAFARAG